MSDGTQDIPPQDSDAGDSTAAATYGGGKLDDPDNFVTTSGSNSSITEGLNTLVSSVITGFDLRAEATASSQDQLAFALDRLTGELDKLLEDAPSPFIMQHSARLVSVRKRVKALNSVLKSIQWRIDNMDRMISVGMMHDKLATEKGGQR